MPTNRNYFINSSQSVVDESLAGYTLSQPLLFLVQKERIVLRKDFESVKSKGQVTILSGGGSGHEPSHAGYVGRGMLTAAVCGDIFASPPVGHILTALRLIGSAAGTVVIVKNYTGDRLNFGLAIDQFRAETNGAVKVEMVLVEDDWATRNSPVGARGLCGTVLFHKILGAMAEEGQSLQAIIDIASTLRPSTLAAALGHATIPSTASQDSPAASSSEPRSDPGESFTSNTYEIGLGIHNEPGIEQRTFEPVKQIVSTVLGNLLPQNPDRCVPADGTIVVVNNLGGLTSFEVNIVTKEVVAWFQAEKLTVSCIITGTLMSSIDMPGFSITVLRATTDTLRRLNTATECKCWPGVLSVNPNCNFNMTPRHDSESTTKAPDSEAHLTDCQAKLFRSAFIQACRAVSAAEAELNYLDSVAGDGDCGTTMAELAGKTLEIAEETTDFSAPRTIFLNLSNVAAEIGGTTGALYGILFSAFANGLSAQDVRNPRVWLDAFSGALEKFVRYSRARPGDRSMLDALTAISYGLCSLGSLGSFGSLSEIGDLVAIAEVLTKTAKSCRVAAETTRVMTAVVGRASYSKDRKDLRKVPDAGAVAVSVWFTALAEVLQAAAAVPGSDVPR